MVSPVPVVIMTSPASNWTLGGLFWTLNKYAPELQDIWVCGYDKGFFDKLRLEFAKNPGLMPKSVNFLTIGKFEEYPKSMWSDSFIKVCEYMRDNDRNHFLFLMDDFWLVRRADVRGINLLYEAMKRNNSLLKVDLATDRLYALGGLKYLYGANTFATEGHLDIIKSYCPSPYHMSFWVGLFSASLLLDHVLVPGETAQEIEVSGTGRLGDRCDDVMVVGTRQAPMRVTNLIRSGHPGQEYRGYHLGDGEWVNGIDQVDLEKMREKGVEVR